MKMITIVVAMCMYMCMAKAARGSATCCGDDAHCPSGFFCEATLLFCQECLRCEDLKREQPVEATACITTAVQCGGCLPGLVENRGDGDAVCVSQHTRGEGLGRPLPAYGWAVIVLVLTLCAMLLCVVAAYVLRNFETFKILASTRASVHTPVETTAMADTVLQQPPPYNIMSVLAARCPVINDEESSWPFIKTVPPPEHTEERENALNQAARVYNNPTYVRGAPIPARYEVEDLSEVSATQFSLENDMDNSNNNNIRATNAAERVCEIPSASAATKLPRVRQDSNTSQHSSGSSSGIGEEADQSGTFSPFTCNGSPVIINVIKNIAAAQQQNVPY